MEHMYTVDLEGPCPSVSFTFAYCTFRVPTVCCCCTPKPCCCCGVWPKPAASSFRFWAVRPKLGTLRSRRGRKTPYQGHHYNDRITVLLANDLMPQTLLKLEIFLVGPPHGIVPYTRSISLPLPHSPSLLPPPLSAYSTIQDRDKLVGGDPTVPVQRQQRQSMCACFPFTTIQGREMA
jgi:hypothetical protein